MCVAVCACVSCVCTAYGITAMATRSVIVGRSTVTPTQTVSIGTSIQISVICTAIDSRGVSTTTITTDIRQIRENAFICIN